MSGDSLPEPQREALESRLRLLIERAGWESFVTAPLIEPSERSFPDPWQPDAHGVGTVARRLLAYAGIPASRVRVNDYTALAEQRTVNAAEVQFAGVTTDGTVEIDLHSMGDEVDLVGALCHEIAAAWLALERVGHGSGDPFRGAPKVEASDDDMELARGSVAAVYLGFGIPATNAAHSARHGGYFTGYYGVTETAITMAGGLSPESMVYLLALHIAVRDRGPERKLTLARLRPNQRADMERWLGQLEPKRVELRKRLSVPSPSEWPEQGEQGEPEPLSAGGVEVSVAVDADEVRQFNRGRKVFRVRNTRIGSRTVLGAVAGLALGMIGLALGLPDLTVVGIGGAGAVAGLIQGSRSYFWECSDRQCAQRLDPDDEVCGFCGGTVAGELLRADDRLEAEEQLERDAS